MLALIMLTMTVKLKLCKPFINRDAKGRINYDVAKLKAKEIRENFICEMKNRFTALDTVSEGAESSVEEEWTNFKETPLTKQLMKF